MHRLLLTLAFGAAASVGTAHGQPAPARATADSTVVRTPRMPSARATLLEAGAFVLATAAVMPLDARLAHAVRSPGPQGSAFLRDGARVANPVGDPGVLVASAALWGVGHVARDSGLVALGAGIGTLAGTRVVAFARAHPHNWVDRHLGALTVAPAPGGLTVGVHRATR